MQQTQVLKAAAISMNFGRAADARRSRVVAKCCTKAATTWRAIDGDDTQDKEKVSGGQKSAIASREAYAVR